MTAQAVQMTIPSRAVIAQVKPQEAIPQMSNAKEAHPVDDYRLYLID